MTPSTNQPAPAKPEHSPLPWWLDDDGFVASGTGDDYRTIADPRLMDAARMREMDANAELIARAVNNHAALVAALEETREACDAMAFIWDDSRFPAEMRKEYAAQFVNLLFPAIRNSRSAIRNATK